MEHRVNRNSEGQGTVETALILVVVTIVVIGVAWWLGSQINSLYSLTVACIETPDKCDEIRREWNTVRPQEDEKTPVASTPRLQGHENTSLIIRAKARRDVNTIDVHVTLSYSSGIWITVRNMGLEQYQWCQKSCVFENIEVGDVGGVVDIIASDGSFVSILYPSKLISTVVKTENLVRFLGGVSGLTLAYLFGKFMWWRVALQIASNLASHGSSEAALFVVHKALMIGEMSTQKAMLVVEVFRSLAINCGNHITNLSLVFEVEKMVVNYLSPRSNLILYTWVGQVCSKVEAFEEAFLKFRAAERLLQVEGESTVPPYVKVHLFSGLGAYYLNKRDGFPHLRVAAKNFILAHRSLEAMKDLNEQRALELEVQGKFIELGTQFVHERQKQQAWGATSIRREKDEKLYLGEGYPLTVEMGWGSLSLSDQSPAFQFDLPLSLEPFTFDVRVWGQDMDIEPSGYQQLELNPILDIPVTAQFTIIPKQTGNKTLTIDFYYQLHWLQQAVIDVEVVEMGSQRGVTSSQEDDLAASSVKVRMLLGSHKYGNRDLIDLAYEGLQEAQSLYDIEVQTLHYESYKKTKVLVKKWAKTGCDLIIAIGSANHTLVSEVAEAFPDTHFVIIDAEISLPNVRSAIFQTYEADYLAGTIAALVTGHEGYVGFIGSMNIPYINQIKEAFEHGIQDVCSTINLVEVYVDRFDTEQDAQFLAQGIYAKGPCVIYQAIEDAGLGTIREANRQGKFVISTGRDHSDIAPSAVITSRVKNLNHPIVDAIRLIIEGSFMGGVTEVYSLANAGVSLLPIRSEVGERLSRYLVGVLQFEELIQQFEDIRSDLITEDRTKLEKQSHIDRTTKNIRGANHENNQKSSSE